MPGRRTVKFATDLGRTELEKGTVSFSFELERGKKEKKRKRKPVYKAYISASSH